MKLIVPVKFYVRGGVERVMFSLLREFDNLIDGVVLLLPDKSIVEFQSNLPEAKNIYYESFTSAGYRRDKHLLKLLTYIGRFGSRLRLKGLHRWSETKIADFKVSECIREIAQRHHCTHCLYFIGNRIQPPRGLEIPLVLISHDLFWRFAPLTYAPKLVREYDDSLYQWLRVADLVIAVSQKTRSDLLKVFPDFKHKVRAIPSASEPPNITTLGISQSSSKFNGEITFFFPSSFSLYKDHLTLLRAAISLHQSGYRFKVVLTGRETDKLVNGDFELSQQKNTKEYAFYVAQLSQLYAESNVAWAEVFVGLGYCSLATVETTYQSCNCVVMPSVYEGFGLAIAEAIVRGLPVIAADIAVFREQVDLYCCPDRVKFFTPGNADSLSQCLVDFMKNPIPRLAPKEAASRFDHWTWRQVALEYINALRSQAVSAPGSAEISPSALDS
ncbi:glycosyltransferase [Leptolyngbya sp. PCC 6406]|uniref:glycosyltransferase n=1 Tax=Leptolyngbya sp. PCC 6406 TaxID=1173264 RepID=UPI0002AD01F5|nr:glycosyltransferase [Leptolyngbya sp. PCC 6406]